MIGRTVGDCVCKDAVRRGGLFTVEDGALFGHHRHHTHLLKQISQYDCLCCDHLEWADMRLNSTKAWCSRMRVANRWCWRTHHVDDTDEGSGQIDEPNATQYRLLAVIRLSTEQQINIARFVSARLMDTALIRPTTGLLAANLVLKD